MTYSAEDWPLGFCAPVDTPPFDLDLPTTQTTAVVVSSPHSGAHYLPDFVAQTAPPLLALRSSEDAFVDALLRSVPQMGAPLISAVAPRAFVDLNRSADELDPAVVDGIRSRGANPRVAAGLGVIPRVVSEGRVIRQGKISAEEAENRLETWYRPYHAALQKLISETRAQFGRCLLLDCHSMPHEALIHARAPGGLLPEVVIGDRFGASCDRSIVEQVVEAFRAADFRVGLNSPFAGAFVTQHYGRPSFGQHALQIEIDRRIYMDETRVEPLSCFDEIRQRIDRALAEVCQAASDRALLAAE